MQAQKKVQFYKVGGEPKAAIPGVLLLQGTGLPLSPRLACSRGSVATMKTGQCRAMDVRPGSWTLRLAPRSPAHCALSRPPQPTLALLHRCKKIFCVIPPGALFLSEILNNINHLDFEQGASQ